MVIIQRPSGVTIKTNKFKTTYLCSRKVVPFHRIIEVSVRIGQYIDFSVNVHEYVESGAIKTGIHAQRIGTNHEFPDCHEFLQPSSPYVTRIWTIYVCLIHYAHDSLCFVFVASILTSCCSRQGLLYWYHHNHMIANEVKLKDVSKLCYQNHKKHNKEPTIRIFLRCTVYLKAL